MWCSVTVLVIVRLVVCGSFSYRYCHVQSAVCRQKLQIVFNPLKPSGYYMHHHVNSHRLFLDKNFKYHLVTCSLGVKHVWKLKEVIFNTSCNVAHYMYRVVQIWPGLFVCKQVTVCPGHIWTTLYYTWKSTTFSLAVHLDLVFNQYPCSQKQKMRIFYDLYLSYCLSSVYALQRFCDWNMYHFLAGKSFSSLICYLVCVLALSVFSVHQLCRCWKNIAAASKISLCTVFRMSECFTSIF
jgi:hypothetical protein